jgi:hypothetical protein
MTNKLWFMLIYYSNNFQVGVDTCIYQLNIDSMLIHQVHYLCLIVGMFKSLHGGLSPTRRTFSNLRILQKCKVSFFFKREKDALHSLIF